MLSVMVVDDEEIIRQRIRNIISWRKHGFEIVAEAEDGEEALQLAKKQSPDLLITDIKMPFVNGLELIKAVKKDNPGTYCVILTGYDEFQFAQEAIEYGATAYLLKPIEAESLAKLLKKILRDYKQVHRKSEEFAGLQAKVAKYSQHEREYVLKNIIHAAWSRNTAFEELAGIDIDGVKNYGCVAILEADERSDNNRNFLSQRFYDFVHECLVNANAVSIIETELRCSVCVWDEDRSSLAARIGALRDTLSERVKNRADFTISIYVGGIYKSLTNLTKSYLDARKVMEYESLCQPNCNTYYREVAGELEPGILEIDFDFNSLITAVRHNDPDTITAQMNEMVKNIKSRGENAPLFSRAMLDHVLIHAFDLLREGNENNAKTVTESPITVLKRLEKIKTIDDKISEVRKVLYDMGVLPSLQ
jgi:two-component system response regulator YesN